MPRERREDLRVEGRERAKLEGERQHPLAYGDRREDAIDERRRLVRHSTTRAARAEATTLAREGDQEIVTAGLAALADEAVRENSASEILTELVFDVARERRAVALAGVRQERRQMLAHERVEHRLGWTAWSIGGRERRHQVAP